MVPKGNHNRNLFDRYVPIYGYDMSALDQTDILISSTTVSTKYDCAQMCTTASDCAMISYKASQCMLFNKVKYSIALSGSDGPYLFEKTVPNYSPIDAYLTNYWPFNNNLNDIVSEANINTGSGYGFGTDRLNSQNSALNLAPGYLQLPAGVYFKGDFTISLWVNPTQISNYGRIIDCGNGPGSYNILIALMPYICSCNTGCQNIHANNNPLTLGKWQHLAYTIKGSSAILYLNGNVVAQGVQNAPISVTRSKCYIGRSNWGADPQTINVLLDDFKIFNVSLTQSQIIGLINSYY
jgi:hypothetical protein